MPNDIRPATATKLTTGQSRRTANVGRWGRIGLLITTGILVATLSACGGGAKKSDAVSANLEAAISAVPNVETVDARYTVNPGMGSTASVRITAVAGTASLETVMTDSLTAFASAAEDLKSNIGVSFQVTEAGQKNTINPLAVGLPQRPSVQEIRKYAASSTAD